ncbi:MAG: heme A synthase [Rhodobacteraceae bacterium]|nr:heme A synthase [Paracoccaceae bacterium]
MAKRSIFEEVGSDTPKPTATTGVIDAAGQGARGPIRIWLVVLFVMVAAMILIGGLTRLTDSGLSITEWAPISGAIPPLNETDWQEQFTAYQATDEFRLQNSAMTLAEFKTIFWWEWGHRQLGRLIGVVWAIGFLGFLFTKRIPRRWTGRLLLLGALGGAQGAVGWWMVASGLGEGVVDVASYRLAIHLGLAFVILGLIAWYILRMARSAHETMTARRNGDAGLTRLMGVLVALTFVQILLGALVAGIDAGRNYTDWPLMAGGILPPDPLSLEPVWRNFFEDDGLVQFMHRVAGYLVVAVGVFAMLRGRRSAVGTTRGAFLAMGAMLVLQMALGVMTVIYSAPLLLAILHQLGAVALWVLILRARFHARYPYPQSLRGPV